MTTPKSVTELPRFAVGDIVRWQPEAVEIFGNSHGMVTEVLGPHQVTVDFDHGFDTDQVVLVHWIERVPPQLKGAA